jgi:hypothetical protein
MRNIQAAEKWIKRNEKYIQTTNTIQTTPTQNQ